MDVAKSKTHFEQVPLAVVKKIVEEESRKGTDKERRRIEIPPVAKAHPRPNSRVLSRKVA
jgi:hypothetical protein